jgi:hypothetical protein
MYNVPLTGVIDVYDADVIVSILLTAFDDTTVLPFIFALPLIFREPVKRVSPTTVNTVSGIEKVLTART